MKTIKVQLEDSLIVGEDINQLATQLREDHILRKYLTADISIGELGNYLNMNTEKAIEWLYDQGLPTIRKMSPYLESQLNANRNDLLNRIQSSKKASPVTA
jgi:hypothetical protein